MMSTVVYLSSKIGMVSGMGIAGVMRNYYPRWLLFPVLGTLLVSNIAGAGADLGAVAVSLRLIVPIPVPVLIVAVTLGILGLQLWGSYDVLQRIFKWLALALFSYVGAAVLAKPDLRAILWGTFTPQLKFNTDYLSLVVAMVGTSLSPYLFFWQAGQEVEEEIAIGRSCVWQRRGCSTEELSHAARDVNIGMFFSNFIIYFIIVCTAATLFRAGHTNIASAYNAAQALRPLAGDAAGLLFAIGVVGVGILAIPVLTTGLAYALAESFEWNHSLDHKPHQAREFYSVIILSTLAAMALNFVGINPITALFWAGIVAGLLCPFLMVLVMLMTNDRKIMGPHTNCRGLNLLGWGTTAATMLAAVSLVGTWLR